MLRAPLTRICSLSAGAEGPTAVIAGHAPGTGGASAELLTHLGDLVMIVNSGDVIDGCLAQR
jgi:hypothetical protein